MSKPSVRLKCHRHSLPWHHRARRLVATRGFSGPVAVHPSLWHRGPADDLTSLKPPTQTSLTAISCADLVQVSTIDATVLKDSGLFPHATMTFQVHLKPPAKTISTVDYVPLHTTVTFLVHSRLRQKYRNVCLHTQIWHFRFIHGSSRNYFYGTVCTHNRDISGPFKTPTEILQYLLPHTTMTFQVHSWL